MLTHAVLPIQQTRNTAGKNATDSKLIIEAMDILHSRKVQGFCIVSSDSDFTGLCMRIREEGLFVMGMGRQQTPEAFVNACEEFLYIENLAPPKKPTQPKKPAQPKQATQPKKKAEPKQAAQPQKTAQPKKAEPKQAAQPQKPAQPKKVEPKQAAQPKKIAQPKKSAQPKNVEPNKAASNGAGLMKILQRAFDTLEPKDGWVHLGELGKALRQVDPSFDSRTYDYKSLSLLVKSLPKKLDVKGVQKTGTSAIYVRLKDS
jgi:hypothetical protein